MKTIYAAIVVCLIAINLNGQKSFNEAMQIGLSDFNKAKTTEDLIAASNQFERIGTVETEQWLPDYYAALIYVIITFKTEDPTKKETLLVKAQLLIDKAMNISQEESEIHTLQGMLYQAYIGIDPMQNGQVYGGRAAASFNEALKYNPQNPRPIYLQAISIMYTPEQYGGGIQAACPMFQQAAQMFESFETTDDFAPKWGGDECAKYLSGCNDVAKK